MVIGKKIIPAIIAKNQQELDENLLKVCELVDIVQLDVMDNVFVPNTSLFFDINLNDFDLLFEAHLMVSKPERWIEKYIEKIDTILVHYESDYNFNNLISTVKERGNRFGFVLNPETSIQEITPFLNKLDQVLIMTVTPGFYGSPFLPEMLDKVSKLRDLKPDLDIEVDGGITDKTIKQVDEAGANLFVSGSFIIKSENIKNSIDKLKHLVS
jgi:ribulose-phosphate 3-epimerase